jgi:nucleoid-associated protein YgaU
MNMTSPAEAKLDARVRPQIIELRARTPYPKRRSADDAVPPPPAPAPARPGRPGRPGSPLRSNPPLRLTRRGRFVVGALAAIGAAAIASLIWLAITGQAQASSSVRPGTPATSSVRRVVVKPGQTLWGIASQADPAADPRAVIGEIMDLNALRGTSIDVGQVLWVPKG